MVPLNWPQKLSSAFLSNAGPPSAEEAANATATATIDRFNLTATKQFINNARSHACILYAGHPHKSLNALLARARADV